jgi:Tfp pilus assembly PilM family ATPase
LPRFLAIDADAHGLFVAAATVRGGAVKLEQTLAHVENGHVLSPASAKDLGTKLKDLLRQADIAPAPALVCVGRERVILKEVKYPPTPPADEPAVVRFQATKDLTESPDEVAIDYLPTPTADPTGERQAMVVFLRRELLAAARVMCETAGLKLAGVTPRPFAVAALAARVVARGEVPAPESADAPIAVLTLSERGGEFTVVRGGWVKFSRTISAPAMASEQSLVAEVRRNLAVYAGLPSGSEVEAVYLSEADAGGDGWFARLRAGLSVPVYAFDPLAGTADEAVSPMLRGRFAGPVGLLAAQAAGPLPINFQQPRQPRAAADPNRTRVLVGILAAVLIVGAAVVGGLLMVGKYDSRVADLRRELRSIEADIARYELDQKRLAAVDDFTSREVVWADELYDLADRFPDISKMRVISLDGKSLPPPSERERQKEEAALKTNPQLAKNPPPKPIATLSLTVATEEPKLPGELVSSFNNDRFYIRPTQAGGSLIAGTSGRSSTQKFTITTQIIRRKPEDYTRRLSVSTPKAPLAPTPAPKPTKSDDDDKEPAPIGPGFGGFDGGFNR